MAGTRDGRRGAFPRGLRSGDWVEVKTAEEILGTLDETHSLDALPFMPEMLRHCGRKFRVFKSAHKTCDTIEHYVNRGMSRAVHLEGLRCDGTGHDGCQAACLLFWKEAWLKPASAGEGRLAGAIEPADRHDATPPGLPSAAMDGLERSTRAAPPHGDAEPRFRCQATEMLKATTPLSVWDPRHYLKDLTSRNVRLRDFLRFGALAVFNMVMRLHWRGRPFPHLKGLAGVKTPARPLDLQPGELVRVRPKAEILKTLNPALRNRGLSFDVEMVPYCERGTYRVLARVEKIIDERTGKMIRMPSACLILDGVTCSGHLSRERMFCPRSIYPYWHEIWLERAEEVER